MMEEKIKTRIEELESLREKTELQGKDLVAQINQRLASITGAIAELQMLLNGASPEGEILSDPPQPSDEHQT